MRLGFVWPTDALTSVTSQKKNTQSGTEFKRTQEAQAAIMREKQAKGVFMIERLALVYWLTSPPQPLLRRKAVVTLLEERRSEMCTRKEFGPMEYKGVVTSLDT
jgi:hypothetical protein